MRELLLMVTKMKLIRSRFICLKTKIFRGIEDPENSKKLSSVQFNLI